MGIIVNFTLINIPKCMVKLLLIFFASSVISIEISSASTLSNNILNDSSLLKIQVVSDSINEGNIEKHSSESASLQHLSILDIEDDKERKQEELLEYGDYIKSFMEQFQKKRIKKTDGRLSIKKMRRMSKRLNPKKNGVNR